jgi:DNA repair exonuclease SbcCD ATPase subunit
MGYRITAVHIHDFKRVRNVEITPPADADLLLLAGRNGQGKSSILDALSAALGGAKALPAEPIRRGASEAEIVVEFDGGALSIQRVIGPKGTSLEVKNADGVLRSPQSMLDKLVGARTLDPLQFLQLKPGDQHAQLMRQIPDAHRIGEANAKREGLFKRRTELGRDRDNAKGELERLRALKVVAGEARDVAALTKEKDELAAVQHESNQFIHAANSAAGDVAMAESLYERQRDQAEATRRQIERLQVELQRLDTEAASTKADLDRKRELAIAAKAKVGEVTEKWKASAARRAELDEQLASADAHNRAIFEADAHAKRLVESEASHKKLHDAYETCSEAIDKIDAWKKKILTAAQLPVAGLKVTEDAILFNGVPFAQASAAERLRVSVALAIAGSPQLDDIWVRDAALVDEDGLKLIAELAGAAGKRVWLERVGTRDAGAIIIEDGAIVGEVAA